MVIIESQKLKRKKKLLLSWLTRDSHYPEIAIINIIVIILCTAEKKKLNINRNQAIHVNRID